MSYLDFDLSESSGSPTELYKFTYNENQYRFCLLDGGADPYVFQGESYIPATIGRDRTEMSEDITRTALDLRVPGNFPVAELFRLSPPEGVVLMTIFRLQLLDDSMEYISVYKGRTISCEFQKDGNEATLHHEPIFSSLRRPGLRMVYDTQCVHGLYSPGCTVLKDLWRVDASILDISGRDVIIQLVSEVPDGWFDGGMLVCGDIRRMIEKHIGVNLTLMHPIQSELTSAACQVYPGCDHTLKDCGGKFSNAENYGGEPWLPDKNPFSGDNIFW